MSVTLNSAHISVSCKNASTCSGYLYSVLEDFGLKDVGDFRDLIDLLDANEEQFEEMSRHKPARDGHDDSSNATFVIVM